MDEKYHNGLGQGRKYRKQILQNLLQNEHKAIVGFTDEEEEKLKEISKNYKKVYDKMGRRDGVVKKDKIKLNDDLEI